MKSLLVVLFSVLCSLAVANVSFQVSYTGFDALQMAAFEHSLSYWEPLLDSEVPIKINARFQNIPGFVVVFVPNMIRNFTAAPQTNVWYCTALANMLSGTELNPGEADMDIFFVGNTDHPWYYGLDDNCPANNYDFVSEAFKAVAYGLGYMPSFYVQQGYGSYGMLNPSVLGLTTSFPWEAMENQPALYDTHVVNTQGQHLTDTAVFTNPSTALNAQLTGGNLRFSGTWAELFAGATQPVLYAGAFNLARTARLNGTTYSGTENESGVPTGQLGGGVRYPAPIVLGILKDLGWSVDPSSLCGPPQNLAAVSTFQDVNLSWDLPTGPYYVHSINVFRDGGQIATLTDNLLSYTDPGLAPGTYEYAVSANYSMGVSAQVSVSVTVNPVSIDDPVAPRPHISQVLIAPNPFMESALLSFNLSRMADTGVDIYNLRGQKVRSLSMGRLSAGTHEIGLDGSDLNAGIYLLKIRSGDQSETRKLLISD